MITLREFALKKCVWWRVAYGRWRVNSEMADDSVQNGLERGKDTTGLEKSHHGAPAEER